MTTNTRYSISSRLLHWLIALLVLVLVPVGIIMAGRAEINLFDDLTNTLYAWHKAIGFSVLLLMIIRVVVRARGGSPPYPRALARGQTVAATALHHFHHFTHLLHHFGHVYRLGCPRRRPATLPQRL